MKITVTHDADWVTTVVDNGYCTQHHTLKIGRYHATVHEFVTKPIKVRVAYGYQYGNDVLLEGTSKTVALAKARAEKVIAARNAKYGN